jgi:hypothetical protein
MQQDPNSADMADTSLRVSEELADELYDRKSRGETYEDVIWSLLQQEDGGLAFTPVGAKNVSYGPSSREGAAYVLRVGTERGTVEIHLDEDEMYALWTEVQHTPWPDTTDDQDEAGELRRHLVDLAMGADAEGLRDALDALDDRPPGERDWR